MTPNCSLMSMSYPLNHLGSIWYHSEPSDDPYSLNQFLGWEFFGRFLQQAGSRISNNFSSSTELSHGYFKTPSFRERAIVLKVLFCILPNCISNPESNQAIL